MGIIKCSTCIQIEGISDSSGPRSYICQKDNACICMLTGHEMSHKNGCEKNVCVGEGVCVRVCKGIGVSCFVCFFVITIMLNFAHWNSPFIHQLTDYDILPGLLLNYIQRVNASVGSSKPVETWRWTESKWGLILFWGELLSTISRIGHNRPITTTTVCRSRPILPNKNSAI